jgi:hypothetical protein
MSTPVYTCDCIPLALEASQLPQEPEPLTRLPFEPSRDSILRTTRITTGIQIMLHCLFLVVHSTPAADTEVPPSNLE